MLKNTKRREFFISDYSIRVNGLFTSEDKPKHSKVFRMVTHAELKGTVLSRNQSDTIKYFSETWVSVINYCTKRALENDAKQFSYDIMSFEEPKTLEKIVEALEKADLVEPTQSYWAAPSILVKKGTKNFRRVREYRGLNKQTEKPVGRCQ